jgi:hypothetical protein
MLFFFMMPCIQTCLLGNILLKIRYQMAMPPFQDARIAGRITNQICPLKEAASQEIFSASYSQTDH